MIRLTIFSILIFFIQAGYAQDLIEISKPEVETSDFFKTGLNNDLKDVQIIGLGESAHMMGETYRTKVNMIKFLHQECRFNTLAFESGMFDIFKTNELLKNGTATRDSLLKSLFGIWHTNEVVPLLDYIIESQKTNNPINIVGIDNQFLRVSKTHLPTDFASFVDSLSKISKADLTLDSLFFKSLKNTMRLSNYFNKVPIEDTLILYNKLEKIKKVIANNRIKDTYFNFWVHIINNIQSDYRKNYNREQRIRDKQMAINIDFWLNQKDNKKMIIWAASSHLIYSTTYIDQTDKNYKHLKPMGNIIKEKYLSKYYFLAFTPFQGKIGFKGYFGLAKSKIKSKEKSFEEFVNNNYGFDYAFYSLRDSKNQNYLEEKGVKSSNILWARNVKMDLSKICDGIFYIKNEKLVTSIKK